MKGIIVGIEDHNAALLSDNGEVVKVVNRNYQIGQEVEVMDKIPVWKKIAAAVSAAACVILFGGVGVYAYYTPYSYVSLDVNPSIEYTLNRFDQVLSVKGVNEDGEHILDQIDLDSLKHMDIEDAVAATVTEIKDAGYFQDGTGGVMITASSDNDKKSADIADALKAQVATTLDTKNTEVNVVATAVEPEFLQQAKAMGVSPGKLKLVENLAAEAGGTAINQSEWINRSVKDIMKETNKFRDQNRDVKHDSKDANDPDTNEETTTTTEGGTTVDADTESRHGESERELQSTWHRENGSESASKENSGVTSATTKEMQKANDDKKYDEEKATTQRTTQSVTQSVTKETIGDQPSANKNEIHETETGDASHSQVHSSDSAKDSEKPETPEHK